MASIEPVTATLIGAVVFREKLSMEGVLGVVLVIAALVICNSSSGDRVKINEKNIGEITRPSEPKSPGGFCV